MCNFNERKLSKEERSKYSVGYKIFCSKVTERIKQVSPLEPLVMVKTGLFSAYTHDIYDDDDNLVACLFYEYKAEDKGKDGYFVTETAPIGATLDDQKGFHVCATLEDAKTLLKDLESYRRLSEDTFFIMKVAVKNVVAIGEFETLNYHGRILTLRCGKLKVIEEVPREA